MFFSIKVYSPFISSFLPSIQGFQQIYPYFRLDKVGRSDTAHWAFSLNIHIAAKFLQQDLLKLAMWCAKWRIKLNPTKTKVIIFSRSILARKTEINLELYVETLKIYPQVKFLGITFDSQLKFKKHFEEILDCCNTRYHRLRLLVNKNGGLAQPP